MKAHKTSFDISDDLIIQRCGTGIKLARPSSSQTDNNPYKISQLIDLPFNIFFTDTDGFFQKINESSAEACGFTSVEDALGKTVYTIAKKEIGNELRATDQLVISSEKMILKEMIYEHMRDDSHEAAFLSVQFPLYNESNEVHGIFGCSLPISQSKLLTKGLMWLTQAGLLTPSIAPVSIINEVPLTRREKEILHQVSLGRNYKTIGKNFRISTRTVEYHIGNLKSKFKVHSRHELIEKMLACNAIQNHGAIIQNQDNA